MTFNEKHHTTLKTRIKKSLDEINVITFIIFFITISGIILIVRLNLLKPYTQFLDERLYVNAGIEYVHGIAPININFEHPPLAKYIIGLSELIGLSNFLPLICIITSVIFLALILKLPGKNSLMILTYLLLVLSDGLVINSVFFRLLDPIALVFLSMAIYFIHRYSFNITKVNFKKLAIISLLLGLATASKLSTLYVILPMMTLSQLILHLYAGHSEEHVVKYLVKLLFLCSIAIMVYVLSFFMDFIHGGFTMFLQHQVKMFSYMRLRHSPTLSLMINGFLTLLTKSSLWIHRSITYIIINNTTTNEVVIPLHNLMIVFKPWLGSFSWFLAFVYTVKAIYFTIKKTNHNDIVLSSAILGSALLPIFHGNIAWYYLFYAVLSPLILVRYASKKLLVILVISNVIQTILLQIHLINTQYTFEVALPKR